MNLKIVVSRRDENPHFVQCEEKAFRSRGCVAVHQSELVAVLLCAYCHCNIKEDIFIYGSDI
jgi:hypothetical protein